MSSNVNVNPIHAPFDETHGAEPMLPPTRRNVAPPLGIIAILVLLAGLGFILHQRLSESDQSWARWEKHELSGVVLGQSPDTKKKPAKRSSAPPLWSQAEKFELPAKLAQDDKPKGAPPQEEQPDTGNHEDPFAGGIVLTAATDSTQSKRPHNEVETAAPRILFQGEDNRLSGAPSARRLPASKPLRELPAQSEFDLPSGSSEHRPEALHRQPARMAQVPAGATGEKNSAASLRSRGAVQPSGVRKTRTAQFQGIRQVAGNEEEAAQVAFPATSPASQLPNPQELRPDGSPRPTYHFAEPAIPAALTPSKQEIEPTPAARSSLPIMRAEEPALPEPALQSSPVSEPALQKTALPEPTLAEPELQPRTLMHSGNAAPIHSLPQEAEQPSFEQSIPASPPSSIKQSGGEQTDTRKTALPAMGLPGSNFDEPAFNESKRPEIKSQQQVQRPVYNEPVPPASTRSSQASVPKEKKLAEDEIHQVQSGDNYWTISRRYYGSARFFSSLAEYNKHRIPEPEMMKPGMYVLVPDVEVLHQRYPELTGGGPRDPAEDAPPGFFVDENGQPAYRVGKGDTLTDIAQAHLGRSSRWVQIVGMNKDRVTNGKPLKIGTVLRLPSDASQVVLAPRDFDLR